MKWWLYVREGAGGEVCGSVFTEQEDGGGAGGPDCGPPDDGEISLGNLSSGDWRLIDGMVPIGVERVSLELASGKTSELELHDSPPPWKDERGSSWWSCPKTSKARSLPASGAARSSIIGAPT